MFRKIVVPMDLTDRHHQAVSTAAELAAQGAGAVTLLHVIETIAGLPPEEEKEFYGRLERTAQTHLDRWGAGLRRRGIPWRTVIRFGGRGAEAARHVTEADADLIVLTAPRFDPANPGFGWGSMSYRISVLSPCPVLLVKYSDTAHPVPTGGPEAREGMNGGH